jgi:hypothetical protein
MAALELVAVIGFEYVNLRLVSITDSSSVRAIKSFSGGFYS